MSVLHHVFFLSYAIKCFGSTAEVEMLMAMSSPTAVANLACFSSTVSIKSFCRPLRGSLLPQSAKPVGFGRQLDSKDSHGFAFIPKRQPHQIVNVFRWFF